MKKLFLLFGMIVGLTLVTSCSQEQKVPKEIEKKVSFLQGNPEIEVAGDATRATIGKNIVFLLQDDSNYRKKYPKVIDSLDIKVKELPYTLKQGAKPFFRVNSESVYYSNRISRKGNYYYGKNASFDKTEQKQFLSQGKGICADQLDVIKKEFEKVLNGLQVKDSIIMIPNSAYTTPIQKIDSGKGFGFGLGNKLFNFLVGLLTGMMILALLLLLLWLLKKLFSLLFDKKQKGNNKEQTTLDCCKTIQEKLDDLSAGQLKISQKIDDCQKQNKPTEKEKCCSNEADIIKATGEAANGGCAEVNIKKSGGSSIYIKINQQPKKITDCNEETLRKIIREELGFLYSTKNEETVFRYALQGSVSNFSLETIGDLKKFLTIMRNKNKK